MCSTFFSDAEEKSGRNRINFNPNILLLNAQSLNLNKIDNLYLDIYNYLNLNFLCFNETWANNDSINALHFSGYKLISFYCRTSFKGGGVAIWAKNGLEVNSIDLTPFCTEKHFEACALKWNDNNVNTLILNCYRSPSGDLNLFCDRIVDVLNNLVKPNINVILCGDFNLDSYNNSKDFNTLCHILACFNLRSVVKWPTRVSDTTLTTIDHIFINFKSEGLCCVFDNIISDHRTVLFDLNNGEIDNSESKKNMSFLKRSFNENAILNFVNMIHNERWESLYNIKDVNEAFTYLTKFLFIILKSVFHCENFIITNQQTKCG